MEFEQTAVKGRAVFDGGRGNAAIPMVRLRRNRPSGAVFGAVTFGGGQVREAIFTLDVRVSADRRFIVYVKRMKSLEMKA